MTFSEFLTFCTVKGLVTYSKFINVTPLGAQYRVLVSNNDTTCTIYYREINGERVMVKNSIRHYDSERTYILKTDFSTNELVDLLL